MTFDKFKELIAIIYNEKTRRDNYIDRIPREFSDLVVENIYSSSLGYLNDLLIDEIFGEFAEDVDYFLYETSGDKTKPNIFIEDREYCVHDLESYFEYAKKELFNEQG